MTALLEARALRKEFAARQGFFGGASGRVRAVDGVDLVVGTAETVALVGESGSGKTTLGRCLLRLIEPTSGSVRFAGEDLLAIPPARLRGRRRAFQMVFQDPFGSLDPRQRVGEILREPLRIHELARGHQEARVRQLLDEVGLPAAAAGRFPHEFSGGQRQRIGIARALATEPELLVADEPVSALDVSVRAQVVNLLAGLQQRFGLAMLLISHDLAFVEQLADRLVVLYLGRVVEEGPLRETLARPRHPYTRSLVDAVPSRAGGTRHRRALGGEVPDPAAPPSGCAFHPRCPRVQELCRRSAPELVAMGAGGSRHLAACHFPEPETAATGSGVS